MRLGADVTVMLGGERALMTGAGEHVEPLPGEKPPLIVVPLDAELSRRAGLPRVRRARPRAHAGRAGGRRAGAARRQFEHVNDLEPAARRLCPLIEPALEALREAGAQYADGQRLRPDGLRHLRRPRALAPLQRTVPAGGGGMKWTWLAAAVVLAGWLIARRHKQQRWFQLGEVVAIVAAVLIGVGVIQLPNFENLLEDAGQALGKWTYLVVGALAFLETGAFLGFIAPGETAVIVGGLVAGQGQISLLALIAIVWACCVAGDVTSYELGRRLGRSWLIKHGERLKVTEERLDQVEGVLREARRDDDPRRPLPRLRAAADAVHRGREQDAAAALPALRRARRGPVVDHVLRARLRLLALDRPAHDLRLARAVRLRHARRARSAGSSRWSTCAAAPRRARRSASSSTSATTSPAGSSWPSSPARSGTWSSSPPRRSPTSPRASPPRASPPATSGWS